MTISKFFTSVSYLLLFLCFFATSKTDAVWNLPSQPISSTITDSFGPVVGVDGCCNAVAVWQADNGGDNSVIMASTLPVNATGWTTPVQLSLNGEDAMQAQVAVSSNGTAVAVWQRDNGLNTIIQGAILPAGSTVWSSTTDLSATGQNANAPQVAIDPNGNAVAAWYRSNGSNTIIQGAILPVGSTIWSSTTDLSSNTIDSFSPQVVVDADGNAVAVWQDFTDNAIQAATLPANSLTWSTSTTISNNDSTQQSSEQQISINASGYAVATWTTHDTINITSAIDSATLQFGGSWSSVLTVSENSSGISDESDVAVDLDGNAVALWIFQPDSFNPNFSIIKAATLLKSASNWSSVSTLTPTSGNSIPADPMVVVDAAGNAIAVWDIDLGSGTLIQASMLPFGGTWTNPSTDLSAANDGDSNPKIAMTPGGYAVVVWEDGEAELIDYTTWTLPPAVTSLNPNHGSTTGGNTVVITGTNFMNVGNVKFGANNALNFSSTCCTSIEAVVPPDSPGTVDVTVTTSLGTSELTPNDHYTYEGSPPPPPTRKRPAKPTHFTATIKKRYHPTRERPYVLKANWERSHSRNVAFYKIYANNSVIKKVSNMNKPFFRQFRDTKHLHRKYRITSISKNGRESRKEKLRLR